MRVLLGVSGGIAAYKSAELVRRFRQRGDEVRVTLTHAAAEFVSPRTLAALSGAAVLEDLFDPAAAAIEHIAEAQAADVVVVAPATAHVLARMAHGMADDYLTTLLLATPAPVVVVPAMNVQMWRHAATVANLEVLRQRGVEIVPPESGELACGMQGEGRMANLEAIVAACDAAVGRARPASRDWTGEIVLITAGPTREALDPVRYLSNRSSGRMGYALAAAAVERGARVMLVSGPVAIAPPAGVEYVAVTTAAEMESAVVARFAACSTAILAAAVADYRPARPSPEKLKKGAAPLQLDLEPTPDILAELGRRKTHQRLVGFAAETDAARGVELARGKLRAKGADLIVLNDVGRVDIGFDVEHNEVTLVTAEAARALARASKREIADQILDALHAVALHA